MTAITMKNLYALNLENKMTKNTSTPNREKSMADDDLIRRGDALALIPDNQAWGAVREAFRALPAQGVRVDALAKAAWEEAMRRYPDAAGALTFFLCASGMNAGAVTPEAEAWRETAIAAYRGDA